MATRLTPRALRGRRAPERRPQPPVRRYPRSRARSRRSDLVPGARRRRPVFSADGERIGAVEHVLADADADLFDGLVIDTCPARAAIASPTRRRSTACYERGVVLTLDAAACERLPEPTESPAVMAADPDDTAPDDLGDKLKRAWN